MANKTSTIVITSTTSKQMESIKKIFVILARKKIQRNIFLNKLL